MPSLLHAVLPYERRLFLLAAMIARRSVQERVAYYFNTGQKAARQTAQFIADTVSLYIRDIHDGRHDPLESQPHS